MHIVLPEVTARVSSLPAASGTPESSNLFMSRAETVAAEALESEVRDLFARVLAGELSRPGSFPTRALDVIRSLDPATARTFRDFCNYTFASIFVVREGESGKWLDTALIMWGW
jgi:hypothetical protein